MTAQIPKTPLAFKIALVNIAVGMMGVSAGFLLKTNTLGMTQFFLGVFLLGVGEFLNNPRVPHLADEEKPSFFERRRNVCGLGNLLDIAGILMIAVGSGTLFL